jgi:hypothetical protein
MKLVLKMLHFQFDKIFGKCTQDRQFANMRLQLIISWHVAPFAYSLVGGGAKFQNLITDQLPFLTIQVELKMYEHSRPVCSNSIDVDTT